VSRYDYVIVGAGSAGCVLANRLTEDPSVSVLLIEAGGPDTNDLIHIPAAFAALFRTEQDWDHSTVWEPNMNNRRVYLPRGKMLGGSSSINAMVYIRGNRRDYDEWATEGCDGWSYADVLPYFKRAEDNERGADSFHGAGGPLRVSEGRARNEMSSAFIEAAQAHGIAATVDFNGLEQDGVGWYQVTQRDGKRGSTAVSYLHPVSERPNLTIETHVQVVKISCADGRAAGVVGVRLGEQLEFRAEREVLLCGGAYNSPHLLQLSGIGRAEELEALQIEQVAQSPGVGMNLSDHPNGGVIYRSPREVSLFGALNDENLGAWMAGEGPLTSNVAEAGGFIRTRAGMEAPDIQFHFVPAIFQGEGLIPAQEHGLTIGACVLKPKSRGYVLVGSPDPTAKPLICHNYLEHQDDVDSMIAGIRAAMELMATAPLADYAGEGLLVPASDSDEDILAHVRATGQTLYHPVGTCKMGRDDDELAVVDSECRVRGVEGLRVVDASVMPSVPRGNTNAPVIALAERAADLIASKTPLAPERVATTDTPALA